MKTIEEKAKEYSQEFGSAELQEVSYNSFVCGASTQKNIDIEEGDIAQQENILEALERQKKIDIGKAELNFCIFCNCYDNCDSRYNCETFEKFCKAMEG